jgi:hypothetical protein
LKDVLQEESRQVEKLLQLLRENYRVKRFRSEVSEKNLGSPMLLVSANFGKIVHYVVVSLHCASFSFPEGNFEVV